MAIAANRLRPVEELDDLYRTNAAQVYGICRLILRDHQEAEDAAQQVFVSAFRALLGGTEPRDPCAWLATIARNESSARARRHRTVSLDSELQDAAQEDPATLVVRRGELAGIWRAIETLPKSQRDVLLLREVRGLSYDELVTDLELSHPSVRSLLNRARHTLRSQLQRGGAALSGAPWLNLVARLFGDGSSPALSSASRSAAVGLGALVFTGGAALVPGSERMQHLRPTPAARHVASAPRPPRNVTVAAAAPVPVRRAVVVTHRPTARVSDDHHSGGGGSDPTNDSTTVGARSGESTSSGSDSHGGPGPSITSDAGGGSDSVTTSGSSGEGGGPGPGTATTPSTTPVLTGTSDGGPAPPESTDSGVSGGSSGSDGGSTSSGSSGSDGGSTSSGNSGSDGGFGSSGSSGSDGGSTSSGSSASDGGSGSSGSSGSDGGSTSLDGGSNGGDGGH
jgi:RNA polymerase sigma factor (sigma-70 family)